MLQASGPSQVPTGSGACVRLHALRGLAHCSPTVGSARSGSGRGGRAVTVQRAEERSERRLSFPRRTSRSPTFSPSLRQSLASASNCPTRIPQSPSLGGWLATRWVGSPISSAYLLYGCDMALGGITAGCGGLAASWRGAGDGTLATAAAAPHAPSLRLPQLNGVLYSTAVALPGRGMQQLSLTCVSCRPPLVLQECGPPSCCWPSWSAPSVHQPLGCSSSAASLLLAPTMQQGHSPPPAVSAWRSALPLPHLARIHWCHRAGRSRPWARTRPPNRLTPSLPFLSPCCCRLRRLRPEHGIWCLRRSPPLQHR